MQRYDINRFAMQNSPSIITRHYQNCCIFIKNTTDASTSQQKYAVRCITARLPNRTKRMNLKMFSTKYRTNLNLLAAGI